MRNKASDRIKVLIAYILHFIRGIKKFYKYFV